MPARNAACCHYFGFFWVWVAGVERGRRRKAQAWAMPPSTVSSAPVVKLAAPEAKRAWARRRAVARPMPLVPPVSRERILAAARREFSRAGFDRLGVRELAAAAEVDPAMIIRSFGSKEALFAAVAQDAFSLDGPFEGPATDLALRVAEHLTQKLPEPAPDGFDEFQFLMRSAASPAAAPLLSAALHAGFVAPLAKRLGGKEAALRAAVLTACVLGFSTLRFALGSEPLERAARRRVTERLAAALQACLEE
jgi:AcrR family transcriptional regulator